MGGRATQVSAFQGALELCLQDLDDADLALVVQLAGVHDVAQVADLVRVMRLEAEAHLRERAADALLARVGALEREAVAATGQCLRDKRQPDHDSPRFGRLGGGL
jgi:hypothetical protein